MTKKNEEWYHVQQAQDAGGQPRINANIHTTNFSLKELEEIVLTSNYPMVKASYMIKDHSGAIVLEGTANCGDQATCTYALKEMLPLSEWSAYETKEGTYLLELAIELESGQVITGHAAFKCILHAGSTASEIEKPDLLERLAAIPIAKPGMSIDKVRQICLDFMRLQCEFPYKVKEEYSYLIESQKRMRRLQAGVVHGGLTYVTKGSGNLYRAAEIYDPATGTLDTDSDIFDNARYLGNACSGGACIAWTRAITSIRSGYTRNMTAVNGYLPVGPYRYSKDVEEFIKTTEDVVGYECKDICRENGEQIMYESYAAMEPADGVGCNGHVRMNAMKPVVVRFPDGTIDGDKSYVRMVEQVCYTPHPNNLRIQPDGSHYTVQGCVDISYTFKQLFDTSYIPFTFAEFTGEKEVEEAWLKLSCGTEKDAVNVEGLKEAKICSNYPISDVFVTILDQEQKEMFRHVYRADDFFIKTMKCEEVLPLEELKAYAGSRMKLYCQLYNGERMTAFEGMLICR